MKSFVQKVLAAIIFIVFVNQAFGGTKVWVGGASGTWSNSANWSPSGTPFGTDTVIFNDNTVVSLDINLTLGSLRVLNFATVELNAPAARDIVLYGSTQESPGLLIDNGSTLIMSTGSSAFHMSFALGAKGWINGTMICKGTSTSGDARLETDNLGTNRIYINGTYRSDKNSGNLIGDTRTLFFNSGSALELNDNGGTVPTANYDKNSIINITGVVTSAPVFLTSGFTDTYYGGIIYDCPLQANDINLSIATSSTYKSILKGSFMVRNTNAKKLSMATNLRNFFVNESFDITALNAVISMGNGSFGQSVMTVGGTFNILEPSTTFNMQENATGNDTLRIGSWLDIKGTLTSNSSSAGLLELNGSAQQWITASGSVTGNINVRLNNAAGASLITDLSLPHQLDLVSGIIQTNSNVLTIWDADLNAITNASATTFVDGVLSRNTTPGLAYSFPVGQGTKYRNITLTSGAAGESEFNVAYFNVDPNIEVSSTLNAPLNALCNTEYWDVYSATSQPASIKLSLDGGIQSSPVNPLETDSIVISSYNGTGWEPALNSSVLFPGNSVTGELTAESGNAEKKQYSFGIKGNALPIKLISFNAYRKETNTAAIEWVTDGTEDRGNFEVLRSADGRNFTSIASIKAIYGKTKYSATDYALQKGISYYKLKMKDGDGAITYSSIASVAEAGNDIIILSVRPTIVQSTATVLLQAPEDNKATIIIYDVLGNAVIKMNVVLLNGNNNIRFNLDALPAGNYKLRVISEKYAPQTVELIHIK